MGKSWKVIFMVVNFILAIYGTDTIFSEEEIKNKPSESKQLSRFGLVNYVPISISEQKNKTIKVLMLLWRGETDAERGFLEELDALGYQVKATVINVNSSLKLLKKILYTELNPRDYDYIYTFGTLVALVATEWSSSSNTPVIFNIVSHPIRAGLISHHEGHNGGNLSGVCTSAPMDLQIKNIQTILPVKHLAVLVYPKEQNCLDSFEALEEVAKERGIILFRIDVNKAEEITTKLSKMGNMDAIYVTSSSFFAENEKLIFDCGLKVPIIGEQMDMVINGAFMGTSVSYLSSGKMDAKIVDINHTFHVPISTIPVQLPEIFCFINKNTAKTLDIQIDDAQLKANNLNIRWIEDKKVFQ